MSSNIRMGPGREFDVVREMLDVWGELASEVGSDAAIVSPAPGSSLVISTDSSFEGVHFRREWMTAREVGYRAVAAALSDLAAAGAKARGVFIALGLPRGWLAEIQPLAAGLGEAVIAAGASARILGGDMARTEVLSLTITVLGEARRPMTRGGARVGDAVFLTGDVGRSRTALEKLLSGDVASLRARERFVRPVPRIAEGVWVAGKGATAAIDISDGVGSELSHLSAASDVRIRVDLEDLPVDAGTDPLFALGSGEEYELMFTAPVEFPVDLFVRELGTPVTRIGLAVPGEPGVELRSRGELIDLPAGHDHF